MTKQGPSAQVTEKKLTEASKATGDISYDIKLAMKFLQDQVSGGASYRRLYLDVLSPAVSLTRMPNFRQN